ncbi:PREDICTED: uncharacterized protein LOC105556947, partial [Vollenhovia emeryi]|uniref:uncharacterized protein LOC105556947 n=1 Tax=Vollenhovia emeryi TaxID=411798 RepID=UPI0005F4CE96
MASTLNMYTVVEFEDGLSVVPKNWLTKDLTKAFWPNYTSTTRHDKAAKVMEEPDSTWSICPIRKIYGTYLNYAVARQKLKQAEEESDLTSNTEKEEYLKKSRKNRAAKVMDTSMSSNDELSDDSFISEIPKVPKMSKTMIKRSLNDIKQSSKDSQENLRKQNCTTEELCEDDDNVNNHVPSMSQKTKVPEPNYDCEQ